MRRFPPAQSGLSLIELMVAMTLGLMITVSLGYILMGSSSTYRTQSASARVQDTGRFALEFIGRNLRMAGRTDITPLSSDNRVGLPGGTVPITGTDSGVADTLTVSYQLSTLNGDVIQDCNGNSAQIAKTEIKNSSGASYAPQLWYGNVTNIISRNGTDIQCLGNGAAQAPQPFAEGVEELQVVYGVDTTGDDTVDSWSTTVPGNLTQIVAVQVCILVRSEGNGVVSTAQTYRNCAGTSVTAGDTRLRRTFTSVFTLRNRVNLLPQ
ncbi:MAG: PilW family protein [Pseudomonadota bacterium]|nr:PilW family protein [Pseudomonadota bacterium]